MSATALDFVTKRLAGAGQRVAWREGDVAAILRRYGAPPGAASTGEIVRAVAEASPVKATAPAGSGPSFTFTISTSAVDRAGDTVAADGWKLDAYRKNPVVLWAHDGTTLPVGRTSKIWIDGNRLRATVELATSLTTAARSLQGMIEGRFVRAASVGFRPIKLKFADDQKRRPGGIDFLEQELLEWSIVTIPANPEALIDGAGTDRAAAAARRLADLAAIRRAAR